MKIKNYEEMSSHEQHELDDAYADLKAAVQTYEQLTGAGSLVDIVYEELWREIEHQRSFAA